MIEPSRKGAIELDVCSSSLEDQISAMLVFVAGAGLNHDLAETAELDMCSSSVRDKILAMLSVVSARSLTLAAAWRIRGSMARA